MKIGKAYAFFNCKASREKIEAELPTVRKLAKTPSKLELSLIEGIKNLKGLNGALSDADLSQVAKEAEDAGIRYVMEAKYPNQTNKETADELSAIINQTYQSQLYSKGEPFVGNITYRYKDGYTFLG